ncbi:uncharacterized protein IWZ02DRAFT_63007 [Phyllosticta citriasiana]|uniref:uncharacterized protein n=1 Tax=Phyllosticta citriasiana TaxID=595635 RepID=UPI0030FD6C98
MAQPLRNPRQTRSSAACDSCRSRKQKCGGEWPTCARCRETGMDCTWPPQLQRGPAKGYLEAIETRLDEVEHILLQLLPLVPTHQLLNSIACPVLTDSTQKRTTQEKRAALDYWTTFPLNSPQALLAWCHDRQKRRGPRSANETVGPPRIASTLGDYHHSSGSVTAPGHQTASSSGDMNHGQRPDAHVSNDSTWKSPSRAFNTSGPPMTESPTTSTSAALHDATPQDVRHDQKSHSSNSVTDYGQVDLSDEFQQKFVW